jgi:hypothetical protein
MSPNPPADGVSYPRVDTIYRPEASGSSAPPIPDSPSYSPTGNWPLAGDSVGSVAVSFSTPSPKKGNTTGSGELLLTPRSHTVE